MSLQPFKYLDPLISIWLNPSMKHTFSLCVILWKEGLSQILICLFS